MTNLTMIGRRAFLGSIAVAAGGLAISTPDSTAAGLTAVPASRLERLTAGANICDWFGYPSEDSAAHFNSYIRKDEAAFMARIGLRHVRLCVAPHIVMDQNSGDIIEEHVKQLEGAIDLFHSAGLLVIVDMHNGDRAAELDGTWQDAFVRFWGLLAARLSSFDPELTILEIINEPVFDRREDEWNVLNARLTAAIRAGAPQHTIMTAGTNWGSIDGLKRLTVLPDKNIVYSFHFYDPFVFTHQGATWTDARVQPLHDVPYPSSPEIVEPLLPDLESSPASKKMLESYGKASWNKAKLETRFRQAVEWGALNQVPVYCGEFGAFPVHCKPEHRANWFRDFGSVLAENRVGWAVWCWDESFGLNRKLVDGNAEVDTMVANALGLKIR